MTLLVPLEVGYKWFIWYFPIEPMKYHFHLQLANFFSAQQNFDNYAFIMHVNLYLPISNLKLNKFNVV